MPMLRHDVPVINGDLRFVISMSEMPDPDGNPRILILHTRTTLTESLGKASDVLYRLVNELPAGLGTAP